MIAKHFLGIASIIHDIALMYMLFFIGVYYQSHQIILIDFLLWVLFCVALYFLNRYLIKKNRTLNLIFLANGIAGILLCILGNFFFLQTQGMGIHFFLTVFFIISAVRTYFASKSKIKSNQILTHLELSFLLTAVVLLMQSINLPITMQEMMPLLFAVFCNLIFLILSRMVTENPVKSKNSSFQGVFLIGTLIALVITFSLGSVVLLSEQGQQIVEKIILTVKNVGSWFLEKIESIFLFLFSLFPQQNGNVDLPEYGGETTSLPQETIENMDVSYLFPAAIIAVLVVTVIILLINLWKNRGKRMNLTDQEEESNILRQPMFHLFAIWEKLKKKVWFMGRCFLHLYSPQMLLIEAEKVGKKKGYPREKGESPNQYLNQLSKTLFTDPAILEEISVFSGVLDQILYGNDQRVYPKEKIKKLKKAFRGAEHY